MASDFKVALSIFANRSRGSETPLLAREIWREGSVRVPEPVSRPTEMDREWTALSELSV